MRKDLGCGGVGCIYRLGFALELICRWWFLLVLVGLSKICCVFFFIKRDSFRVGRYFVLLVMIVGRDGIEIRICDRYLA